MIFFVSNAIPLSLTFLYHRQQYICFENSSSKKFKSPLRWSLIFDRFYFAAQKRSESKIHEGDVLHETGYPGNFIQDFCTIYFTLTFNKLGQGL